MFSDILERTLALLEFTSPWELAAVVLALAYLMLAVKRSLWCWFCGLASSAIYVALMIDRRLYMEAALNVFYVAMAVYGYIQWRKGLDTAGEVAITQWKLSTHVAAVSGVLLLTVVNGWLLTGTNAAYPYVDAFITWGSVLTTWMVARRVIENWLYWIVVDGIAAYIYFLRGLVATGILFIVYICIVVHGYRIWLREARSATAH